MTVYPYEEQVLLTARVRMLFKGNDFNPDNHGLMHAAIGIAGECGELLEEALNAILQQRTINTANIIEELGDTDFYLHALYTHADIDRDAAIHTAVPTVWRGSILDATTRLQIEATKVLDETKKVWAYNKPLNRINVLGSLHMMELYMQTIRTHLGVTRDEVLAQNREKLAKRYPQGVYTDTAAQQRADKAEVPHGET